MTDDYSDDPPPPESSKRSSNPSSRRSPKTLHLIKEINKLVGLDQKPNLYINKNLKEN